MLAEPTGDLRRVPLLRGIDQVRLGQVEPRRHPIGQHVGKRTGSQRGFPFPCGHGREAAEAGGFLARRVQIVAEEELSREPECFGYRVNGFRLGFVVGPFEPRHRDRRHADEIGQGFARQLPASPRQSQTGWIEHNTYFLVISKSNSCGGSPPPASKLISLRSPLLTMKTRSWKPRN